MTGELHNDQNNPAEPNKKVQTNCCTICKKDYCICPQKGDESNQQTSGENSKNDEKPARTDPPKISWI